MYPGSSPEDPNTTDADMKGDTADSGKIPQTPEGTSDIPAEGPEIGTAEDEKGENDTRRTENITEEAAEPRSASTELGDRPSLGEDDKQPTRPPRKKKSLKKAASSQASANQEDIPENHQDKELEKKEQEKENREAGELHLRQRQKEKEEKEDKAKSQTKKNNDDQEKKEKKKKGEEKEDRNKIPDQEKQGDLCLSSDDSCIRLKKELGLLDSVGLIMGNIIGSGIFMSPRGVLQYSGSVGMSLVLWVATGFVSMVGALCYAEMGKCLRSWGTGHWRTG